jgi:hypothetical protein
MTLTPEQEARVISEAAAIVAERTWQTVQGRLNEVACVSIPRAAAIVDINERQLRSILTETVQFGPGSHKVSLATIERIIEARKVSTAAKAKRKAKKS